MVYVDNDISAGGARKRPAYTALLEAVELGAVDAVIVWDLDRLHRRPIELEEFFNVCDKAGLHKLASVGGDVDLATGEGMLVARIKGAVAAEEIAKISRRSKRKKQELAERGLPPGGGRRPFGFADDRISHVPIEAAALRHAATRIFAGEPLRAIARDFNEHGPAPVFGGPWRSGALWKALTAPRTAGFREYHGEIIGEAAWLPILDRTTWERVRRILTDPARRTNAEARKYLLSGGIARCGKCGHNMVGRPHHRSTPAYWCAFKPEGGCNGTVIGAEPLEELVVEAVMCVLDTPNLVGARRAEKRQSTTDDEALIVQAESKLEELAEAWARNEITRAEWMAARKTLEARLQAAKRRVSAVSSSAALAAFGKPGALRAAWPDLTIERKRAVIAAVVESVTIGPGRQGYNRFDPSRVAVAWRA
jgi:DNA invertase Pin-like site-specific DNA recombinase